MKKFFFVVMLMAVLAVVPVVQAIQKGDMSDRNMQQEKFKVVLEQLKAEIAAEGGTYTVGYNPAVQYPLEQLCSMNPNLPFSSLYKGPAMDQGEFSVAMALPASYLGYYTPIKNQGNCGSCWAFAAIGLHESMILKNTGSTVDLSEQYMLSCNPFGWGCGGGFWPQDMLVSPGSALESCFPYVASAVPCNSSCPTPYQIQSWAFVTEDWVVPATDLIKQAIYTYGAVQAGVYADRNLQYYTSGTFNTCKKYRYTNHAIMLVGWDETKGAWRMKNSWGTGWGEQGFMWIKYACNRVGEGANYYIY